MGSEFFSVGARQGCPPLPASQVKGVSSITFLLAGSASAYRRVFAAELRGLGFAPQRHWNKLKAAASAANGGG